jgi:DNA-binding NarL/FixJ family response regulator
VVVRGPIVVSQPKVVDGLSNSYVQLQEGIQAPFAAGPDGGLSPRRLLVVDQHPVTRWGIAHIVELHNDLHLVGEAGNAVDAIYLAETLRPDVITVGVTLPDRDGIDVAGELRDRLPSLGIVIFTSSADDSALFRAIDKGASAFLSKQACPEEILEAIRHAAVAGAAFSTPGLADALRRRQETSTSPLLSERESQVLHLLLDGSSVPTVAATLFVSLSTAKTYVARLYDKLGANNRTHALMQAMRFGLIQGATDRVSAHPGICR